MKPGEIVKIPGVQNWADYDFKTETPLRHEILFRRYMIIGRLPGPFYYAAKIRSNGFEADRRIKKFMIFRESNGEIEPRGQYIFTEIDRIADERLVPEEAVRRIMAKKTVLICSKCGKHHISLRAKHGDTCDGDNFHCLGLVVHEPRANVEGVK